MEIVIYCPRPKVKHMSYITEAQRYTIAAMKKEGYNNSEIAHCVGKHKSTIGREIKRNRDQRNGEYRCDLAQRKYEERKSEAPTYTKMTPSIINYIEIKLAKRWSPEQISNEGKKKGLNMVSHERIYQHIIEDKKKGGKLHLFLRRKKKYRNRCKPVDKRGKIKDAVSIKERPKVVDEKSRIGDLEVDLVIGANHKKALVTINDRRTGRCWIQLVNSKDSQEVSKAIIKALMPYKDQLHTITSDNGKEFGNHKMIAEKLGIKFYFAEPYSSWQRGANENLNGLIRQYYPKKSSFEELTQQELNKVMRELNQRPRKKLGFKTPEKEFIFLTKKVAFAA